MNEFVLLALSAVITVVIVAPIHLLRRRLASTAWRDFLGITMVFVVLVWATLAMILGEHVGA
jgi:hypothetical protein